MKNTTKKIKVAIAVVAIAAGSGIATVAASTIKDSKSSIQIEKEYSDINHYIYNDIHNGETINKDNNGIKTILKYSNNRIEGVMVNISSKIVNNSSLYLHYRDGDKINIHDSGLLEPGCISVVSIPNPKYKNNDTTIGLEIKVVEKK